MNIYEVIRADHDRQRTLLDLLVKTRGDSSGRRELFARLGTELKAHANAEEQSLYAAMLSDSLTQEKARHSVAEHKDIDDLLDELSERDMSDAHWLQKAKELQELVEHHLDEEEKEVFQLSGRGLDDEQKRELADTFRHCKERELRAQKSAA